MRIVECVQGSDTWFDARRGIPSASNFRRFITPKGRKFSEQGASTYIDQLVGESLSIYHPERVEAYTSRSMAFGTQIEAEARNWYSLETGEDVQQVGLCVTDDGRFCCSPDGIIEMRKGLELKCCESHTHVRYLREGGLPADHAAQCHGGMIVTGFKEWAFLSYSPGLAPLLVKVVPDDFTTELRVALELFWKRYQATLERVKSL